MRVQLYANPFAGTIARVWNKEKTRLHGITRSARVGAAPLSCRRFIPTALHVSHQTHLGRRRMSSNGASEDSASSCRIILEDGVGLLADAAGMLAFLNV